MLYDFGEASGLAEEVTTPVELLDLLCPFQPRMPTLEVRVSSLAFIRYDNRDIVKQISQRLIVYEDELKKAGLRKRSSALESHAQ